MVEHSVKISLSDSDELDRVQAGVAMAVNKMQRDGFRFRYTEQDVIKYADDGAPEEVAILLSIVGNEYKSLFEYFKGLRSNAVDVSYTCWDSDNGRAMSTDPMYAGTCDCSVVVVDRTLGCNLNGAADILMSWYYSLDEPAATTLGDLKELQTVLKERGYTGLIRRRLGSKDGLRLFVEGLNMLISDRGIVFRVVYCDPIEV